MRRIDAARVGVWRQGWPTTGRGESRLMTIASYARRVSASSRRAGSSLPTSLPSGSLRLKRAGGSSTPRAALYAA